MGKEEIMSKLSRLSEIVGEAREIVSSLEAFCQEMEEKFGPYANIPVERIPLPKGLQRRFLEGCRMNSVKNLRQLIGYRRRDLLYWRNIGQGVVDEVAKSLKREYDIDWV